MTDPTEAKPNKETLDRDTLQKTQSPSLFSDIDRALVTSALADKLRRAGVTVPMSAIVRATEAISHIGPMSLDELYWLTRLSFVVDRRQLETFDELFDAVFDTDHRNRDRRSSKANTQSHSRPGDEQHSVRLTADQSPAIDGGGVPWATLPSLSEDAESESDNDDQLAIEERLPSADAGLESRPFDLMDDSELSRIGRLIESSLAQWPMRKSRRRRGGINGDRPNLRATLRHAMHTGGEPMKLHLSSRVNRPRPVAVFVDMSGSMESYTRAYLHVARPLAIIGKAEVFAFATQTTRITASLRLRSPVEAIERASDDVGDRFGGTRIATSLRSVLRHRTWNSTLRGAVVLIVSDGWDTDGPDELDYCMARLARLAHRIVWVNPRQSADQFEPTVASMAAALPYCDHFLSGHSLAAMERVLEAISDDR